MANLSTENYSQGFLVDQDLMAGVTQDPEKPGVYVAFVLQHSTGEYLGYQPFNELSQALQVINQIPRPWTFEKISGGCGGGKCGEGGGCATGSCAIGGGKCGKGQC
jgi:hypothetical protein